MRATLALAILLVLAKSGSVAAEPGLLQASAATCRTLLEHRPDPDVAFRPGVDARGRPVADANVAGTRPARFAPTLIEIDVDLFRRLGIPVDGKQNYNGRAIIGLAEVDAEGNLVLNRHRLPGEIGRRLSVSCARAN